MQNDTVASVSLLEGASEEKKKQILEFLQKRHEYRSRVAVHPASEPPGTVPLPPASPGKLLKGQNTTRVVLPRSGGAAEDKALEKTPVVLEPAIAGSNKQKEDDAEKQIPVQRESRPCVSYALVVVCSTFRYLPPLGDKSKEIASQLFHALTDSHFGRCSRRGSKLLLNPSLIEFQDTMKELVQLCREGGDEASFFMCFVSHGAHVTSGMNEGSYALFSESRLSSEEELQLTAMHENDLAKMIHDIPCRNKLLAFELCQVKQVKEKPGDAAPTIVHRIHDGFSRGLYKRLVQFELSVQQKAQPTLTEAGLLSSRSFNSVLLDSCDVEHEAPVRCLEDNVSNFLHRLNDAFRGAAATVPLDGTDEPTPRGSIGAGEICRYVRAAVAADARRQNDAVKAEYQKQVRTKYELVAEFEDTTHTPQLVGLDRLVDFRVAAIPAAPELAPTTPRVAGASTTSITLEWDAGFGGFHPTTSIEVPTILGYHIQIRGDGRACEHWRRASDYQVLSFDNACREKRAPPTQVTVYGLPCDAAFRFRIRARTAGGWGPFSCESPPFRTRPHITTHTTFSTVDSVFQNHGVRGLQKLMQQYPSNRDVLRTSIEFLARASLQDMDQSTGDPAYTVPLDVVAPIVGLVMQAVEKFSEDPVPARCACLFIGHLAQSHGMYRKLLRSIREPQLVSALLDQIATQFATTHKETSDTALWAFTRLRGISGRYRMSPDAAAKRIQGLYRTRKARAYVRSLASTVYTQLVDPSSGQIYFYNSATGTTSWSLPAFLGK